MTETMQRPIGGCANCGGPVRTRKPGFGWTCAKCVADYDRHPPRRWSGTEKGPVERRNDPEPDEGTA